MQFIIFDIEIYKTLENLVDVFCIAKHKDEVNYFRNPNQFIEYVKNIQRTTNQPVCIVGYNSLTFDLIFLSIWKGLYLKYSDINQINQKIYDILRYWFDVGNNNVNLPFYAQINSLTNHPEHRNVDSSEVIEWIKTYHPSYRIENMFGLPNRYQVNGTIYHLDLFSSIYTSGSLKVRSLIQGVDTFKTKNIIDFNHDELKDIKLVEEYALADIEATEGLLYKDNVAVDYVKTCILSIHTFNIVGIFNIDSTDCLKNRTKELKEYFNYMKPAQKTGDKTYSDVPEYLKFEQNLADISQVNFFVDEYKFYKYNKGVKQFKYSMSLINKSGVQNRGGLHCSEDYTILEEDESDLTFVLEIDFGALYPNIMASDLCPITNSIGKQEIRNNIEKREALKAKGNPTQAVYKLINNTLYGLIPHLLGAKAESKDTNAFNYCLNYVTRIAQVSIIKLIQFVIDKFDKVRIGNINTDSIMFQCSGTEKHIIQKTIDEFNSSFGLHSSSANVTFYKSIIIFNTNNYLKITTDGKIKYMGGKLDGVKSVVASGIDYPLFLNCKSMFFKFIESALSKGYKLTDTRLLENLNEILKPIIDEEKPLLFYKKIKEVSEIIKGQLIDASDISTNSLTSKNFRYSDIQEDPYTFCYMFFGNLYSKFFLINYQEVVSDFKQGKIFTNHIYSKDFIRSKYLTKSYNRPVLFTNFLIHEAYNSVKLSNDIELAPKSKVKVPLQKPTDVIEALSIDATKVLTPTQIEDKKFHFILPYVYDFDFKCKGENGVVSQAHIESVMKVKQELIEDLKVLYEKHPHACLLIEWNDHIGSYDNQPIQKNGIHVIVLGLLKGKADFTQILKKYEQHLDKREPENNITMYSTWEKKNYQCLGSKAILVEYISKLFNFMYDSELHDLEISKKEIIHNAQKSSLVANVSNTTQLEEKYKSYKLPFKDLTADQANLLSFIYENVTYSFSSTRREWFKELGRIKWILGALLAKEGLNEFGDESKTFLYDVLVKLCLTCKLTGKNSPNFNISDVTQTCLFQIYEAYGNGLYKCVFKGIYRETYNTMFQLLDPSQLLQFSKPENIELAKKIINVISNHKSDDVEIIEEINESVLQNDISFIEAPTGIGKTHNIVEVITDGVINDYNRLYLVFSSTKNELKQLNDRLCDKDLGTKIGVFTDDLKIIFDKEREYNVILITSAYLATGDILPIKLREAIEFNLRMGKVIYSIIDEVDNAISALGKQAPIITPYLYTEADFTTTNNEGFDIQRLEELTDEASPKLDGELLRFLRASLSNSLTQSYTTTLNIAQGYTSVHHKGSCLKGCITDIENHLIYASCVKVGHYGSIYNPSIFSVPFKISKDYIFNDGSLFEPNRALRIEEILEPDALVNTEPLKIFNPSEKFYQNMTWCTHKLEETENYEKKYIIQIKRCKLPKAEQYYFNGDYPCGSYLYTYIKYEGFDALIRMSECLVMLTATKDLKTTSLLKRYERMGKAVKYYALVNSRDSVNKLKNVDFNIHIDGNITNSTKDIYQKNIDSNIFIFKDLTFFNRSSKLKNTNVDKIGNVDDVKVKSSLGGELSCELEERIDKYGNPSLVIPEGSTNIFSFGKSTISRGLTIQASRVNIEFGNVGVMYDPFFIAYLVENLDISNYSIDEVIALYEEYNNDISTTLTIQCMGRVLRKFVNVVTQEDNLSGREINLYIPQKDYLLVLKMLNNLLPRCDLSTFKINMINHVNADKLDVTHLIRLI